MRAIVGKIAAVGHPLTRLSRKVLVGRGPLAKLLLGEGLHPVFQPIGSLLDGAVYAHEALIRGPVGSDLHTPDTLFKAAAAESLEFEFETACAISVLDQWGVINDPGRLFVNISAAVLVQVWRACGAQALLNMLGGFGVLPRMLVLEITEHERVADMDHLATVVDAIRAAGVSLALDDFGDGRSSLRLWSQLTPEFVKIDKYFTKGISHSADKLKTVQALQQIAAIFNTALVAEGIETAQDLRVLRDIGIRYGQGYYLGRPELQPMSLLATQACAILNDRMVAVLPELGAISQTGHLLRIAVVDAPTAAPSTTNDELAEMLFASSQHNAVAVVDGGRPVAIINRTKFLSEYSRLYFRELWGRKSCMMLANTAPRIIERDHKIDELVGILASDDQRYLVDGFIVTENGRCVGLGTGDQLVRSVTERRIEAARHANPLTFLPGNVPISQHIDRLLANGAEFVACYADLNNFKPFNDQYGYWRGDEMIRLLAKILLSHCDPQRDFVGHVGGDDFVVLFQSADWHARCGRVIGDLATQAQLLFDESARSAGGIQAEDRHGVMRFFPCTSLSIGAVPVRVGHYSRADAVASAAALAKHHAKTSGAGLHVLGDMPAQS